MMNKKKVWVRMIMSECCNLCDPLGTLSLRPYLTFENKMVYYRCGTEKVN